MQRLRQILSYRVQETPTTLGRIHTIGIAGCIAPLVLAVMLVLIGCQDSVDDDNGSGISTPATNVQNIISTAVSSSSIALIWALPIDTAGYLGVIISAEPNFGSLSSPVELDNNITQYQATNLEPATVYTFTIATRYSTSGKNNSAAIIISTGGIPTEATKVQDATSITISTTSVALHWDIPIDTTGYLGAIISEESHSGSLAVPVDVHADTTTYTVTNLEADTEYVFTIITRYDDSGKDNSVIIVGMSALPTEVQAVDINNHATTSESVTLTWDDPKDIVGYIGVLVTINVDTSVDSLVPQSVPDAGPNTLTINGLDADTPYTLVLTFVTEYSSDKGSSSMHIVSFRTQSNRIDNAMADNTSTTTAPAITLTWDAPEDTVHYTGVAISADFAIPSVTVETPITTTTIADLTAGVSYTFTLTTQYSDGKSGGSVDIIVTAQNPVDRDGDGFVDISSLERLDNMRYNLDLNDGRYKTGNSDSGTRCGIAADIACTGYELIRNLNFADAASYDSGIINSVWRPQSSSAVLLQKNADSATNAGWPPVGSCNGDSDDEGIDPCNDFANNNDTPFNTIFEGNGFVISNLYARNTLTVMDDAQGNSIGLFGFIDTDSVIRSLGVANSALYGNSGDNDYIGALVGYNSGGTITGSYASGTLNGGAGKNDSVGGLAGYNKGIVIASYATGIINVGAGNRDVGGGLVGINRGTIIASYATGAVSGGADAGDWVGGLVGYNGFGLIIAAYSTGTVNGGSSSNDGVGGLVGWNTHVISASYAVGNVNGGAGADDVVGSLVGLDDSRSISSSYGFGASMNGEVDGITGPIPMVAIGSGRVGAALLTAPDSSGTISTAVDAAWNTARSNTADVWDFGSTADIPALRYADYDGAGAEYGCGATIGSAATIPSIIPDGAGGTIAVICGETLLPGQRQ